MLKLLNTLSGKKEIFKPKILQQSQRKSKKINLFVCGPTVYDFSHLGHARTYTVFDMIAKYLRQKGYQVFYLQNITDIDDKIINRAKEQNIYWKELSKKFEKEYLKDMKALGIDSVNQYAPATKHIKEVISQVERLFKKGYAYQIEDGIYYDISKFKEYGKLSKRTAFQAQDAVSRIDEAVKKRNKGDFCLWKFSKPNEPRWKSPWGFGRPGWHIEDTAIAEKFFGFQYDIHGGAIELSFPHHEAEIAQMEAISEKKPFVKYWLHTGLLTINGQKMSKSLKNFITIREFLTRHHSRLLRLFFLKTHYRSPIDYSEKEIEQAKKELQRIDEFLDKIKNLKIKNQKNKSKITITKYEKEFEEAMEDDFNTPKAMAVIFELINKGNTLISQNKLEPKKAKEIFNFFKKIDQFLNFIFWEKKKEKVPKKILDLVKKREEYRKKGDWKMADELREKIKELGYFIEDTKVGPKIKKV